MIMIGLTLFTSAAILTSLALFDSLRGRWDSPTPRSGESYAAWLSLLAAITALAFLLAVPVYSGRYNRVSISRNGQVAEGAFEWRRSLFEVNGPRSIAAVPFPVAMAAWPILLRKSKARSLIEAIAGLILAALTVIAGFSIGMFYLPSTVSMALAAFLGRNVACTGS